MKQPTVWLFLFLAAGFSILTAAVGASAPVASFTANTTGGEIPLSVLFVDTSTNTPTSWTWSFGDGGTSTSEDPVHTYTSAGTYTVTLTATNADGSNTVTRSSYITVSKSVTAPVSVFLANATSGSAPLAVRFVDASTNSPTTWAWSFGDGGTSSEQNPVHTYTSAGSYTVTLTAVNSVGSSTVSKDAYVSVSSSSSSPVASFTATETEGPCPLAVQFVDSSTNTPTSWVWSFGDGITSSDQNPSHTYTTPGTYTVTLTVTNAGGSSTVTEVDYITAEEAEPIASFTANVTSGHPPLAVQFTDTSSNAPTSWYWYFSDGGSSTDQNPVHEFETAGTYTVAFTATNDEGSNTTTKTRCINVTAVDSPEPSFTADITSGTAPLTVHFTDTSTNAPVSWEWNFGDGSTSTLKNPSHQYTSGGTYTVVLTATNAGGSRTTTSSHYITVTSLEETMTAAVPEPTVAPMTSEEPSATATASDTPAPTQSSQGSSSFTTLAIVAVVIFAGIGAIAFILKNRSRHGPSHSRRREL